MSRFENAPFQKIAFRFLACYFLLFCLSNQFITTAVFDPIWRKIVPWFAEHILQLDNKITVFTNGSGDTTYNYVSLLVYVVVALLITLIWSVAEKQASFTSRALQWLIILIRYYLVYQMVIYGLAKLMYLQFQPPHFDKLVQPYGDASPMGLLWTFMGYSKGYTMFTGFGELVGGLLLLSRRTRTLGALIVFGVMGHVMSLNFFYDVPVKILSTHLVLMALFLIALDSKRLWNFFIANKSTEAANIPPLFNNPEYEKIKDIIKWVLVSLGLLGGLIYMSNLMRKWGPNANKPVLYGLYEVETFERNGNERPPLLTDYTRWRRIIIERKGTAMVHLMNDTRQFYDFEVDTSNYTIAINQASDSSRVDTLHFSYPDSTHMLFEGTFQGDTLKILTLIKQKKDFPLMNRKFNWVSEYPFNR